MSVVHISLDASLGYVYILSKALIIWIESSGEGRVPMKSKYALLIDGGVEPEDSGLAAAELRNYEITFRRVLGETLESIALSHGLTREAVRQITHRTYGAGLEEALENRKTRAKRAFDATVTEISNFVLSHKGLTVDELQSWYPDAQDVPISNLPGSVTKFIDNGLSSKTYAAVWTDEKILHAIAKAGTYFFPLARTDYEELVKAGEVDGPSAALVMQRFEYWSRACSLAGVESHNTYLTYSKKWSETEQLDFVLQFLDTEIPGSSMALYEKWKSDSNPHAPSSQLLRNTFGGWRHVTHVALGRLRESWSSVKTEVVRQQENTSLGEGLEMNLGAESVKLDEKLAKFIVPSDRKNIWESAKNLLDMGDAGKSTVMGLGYVQSGKTTSITALCTSAADRGYGIIVAILGSTNLLKDQNRTRVEENLGLEDRNYTWYSIPEFNQATTPTEINDYLERGRTVFIPVIKNATVINKIAKILQTANIQGVKTLIIDDEADQGSLNTRLSTAESSSTYKAILNVRDAVGSHLFVQYTATPYAPLLLPDDDPLMPEDLEFLRPGKGYTGGREFFIEHQHKVVRVIPESDEQAAKSNLNVLPQTLEKALANFFVGATHLFSESESNAPISMLIHSTFKNDLQERYRFLVDRYIRQMRAEVDLASSYFGSLIRAEREFLYSLGVGQMGDAEFWSKLKFTLLETTVWLVNSASDVKQIKWNSAPFHILLGGNKLDRGFTVEGLTVTYMNRPATLQVDTLEQRARAFGYRTALLPFCQFFATLRTIKLLVGIVHTEDDLRTSLRDTLERGGSVKDWAKEIGLLLPSGAKASRSNVLPSLTHFSPDGDWQSLRRPSLLRADIEKNAELIERLGIHKASFKQYGRMAIRTRSVAVSELVSFLEGWAIDPASPGWRQDEILDFLKRSRTSEREAVVFLMESPDKPGEPRIRKWADDTGFVNLFQGRDLVGQGYVGDRDFANDEFDENTVMLQIHRVTRRGYDDTNMFTLAARLGGHTIVRKIGGTNV